MPDLCGVCGTVHVCRNNANATPCSRHKKDGSACGGAALTGVSVCLQHGGNAPSIQKRHQATVAALAMGLDPSTVAANPLRALSAYAEETARQYRSVKDALGPMLDTLEGAVYTADDMVERVRAKVTIFERVADRTERSLTALAKLNIDERLCRIETAKAAYVISALEAAMEAAGCDVTQRERARIALVTELDRGKPQLRGAAG